MGICPYCGRDVDMSNMTREHFFPKSLVSNTWDFWCCNSCNHLKRDHIVYPTTNIFAVTPANFDPRKHAELWRSAPFTKYSMIVPWMHMKRIFAGEATYDGEYTFTLDEEQYYGFDELRRVIRYSERMIKHLAAAQALVLSTTDSQMFLVVSGCKPFTTPFSRLRVVTPQYFESPMHRGYLVRGSGERMLWKSVSYKQDYFTRLLSL